MSEPESYLLQKIAVVESPFREKFGIPRQPGLCPHIPGVITILPPFNKIDAFRGLEESSHIWVLFMFHHSSTQEWQPLVRPPKLGGKIRKGVFATRSPFRPNRIGQSVVKFEGQETAKNKILLHISGHDFLDGTPVIDIKPYIPYSDQIEAATSNYSLLEDERKCKIVFSQQALDQCILWNQNNKGDLQLMLSEILEQDPRPGYHKETQPTRDYRFRLFDLEIQFTSKNNLLTVTNINNY